MRNLYLVYLLIAFTAVLVSCSNPANPLMPGSDDSTNQVITQPLVAKGSEISAISADRGVFGAWKVRVDKSTLSAEIIPARSAQAIGNIFDSDLSQFLTVSPCSNCLVIPRIMIDGYGDLLMEVGMKHPFGNLAARPDLHGFDVRAIFISSYYYSVDYPDIKVMKPDATLEDAHLNRAYDGFLNADGYTSDYDWLPTDTRYFINGNDLAGNLNPFLRFFEDYTTNPFDPQSPSGHNVMPVGSGYNSKIAVFSRLVFDIDIPFEFYVVADVAYGQSAVFSNRTSPQYYLPAFNRTEPWKVEYWIENNNLQAYNTTSTADFVVQVCDWQHSAVVDPDYPNPANPGGIPQSSKVLQLELSSPQLMSTPMIVTAPESGTGTPQDPLQYRFTVINEQGTDVNASGLLAVRDELHGAASPQGRLPIPASPAGFPYDTQDLLDYTYYLPIEINFKNPLYMFMDTTSVINGELFYNLKDSFANYKRTVIKPDFFMDESHRKFQYKWDYEYDGITFDVDGSGLPSPEIVFPESGRYNVGLKVKTNTQPPREYIYEIPVFSQGEVLYDRLPYITPLDDKTSSMKNHSAYIADDGTVYTVFTHNASLGRDIMLAIINPDGNITFSGVVTNNNVKFMPSLTVIERGLNTGVYIAYCQITAGDSLIIATHGNLDGTGFDPAHAVRVSSTASPAWEINPIINYSDNKLHVYYLNTAFIFSQIYGSHSSDYGGIWIGDGWLVDNGSNTQYYQAVASSSTRTYLVWYDAVNYTTNGSDLYMADSEDGVSFSNIKNISSHSGLMWEVYPSACFYSNKLAIAYQMYPEGSSTRDIYLKVLNLLNGSALEYPVEISSADSTFTQPSIGSASDGRYIISYGDLDPVALTMNAKVIEIVESDRPGYFYKMNYYDESMGNVDSVITEIYPVIASRSPSPYVVENYFAWTDFTDGHHQSADSPVQNFGHIQYSTYISEKYENEF
jgi:hypothetical protein